MKHPVHEGDADGSHAPEEAHLRTSLETYRGLVRTYHKTLDLVSDNALERFDRHLADAVRYADVIAGLSPTAASVLDLGSGVGLPGIVIGIANPASSVLLVERRRRRAAFLELAVGRLGLKNTRVVQGDVRDIHAEPVDIVTAQAVGSLLEVYRMTCRLHAEEVVLISRKGDGWREEVDAAYAALDTVIAVVAEVPLEQRGTLVALRLAGGRACPS